MTWIQSCLQMAQERKAQEVLFRSQKPVQMRVGRELVPLISAAPSAQETRQILAQILSDEEKRALYEDLKVEGAKVIGSIAFKFDFQIDLEGVHGSIQLQPQQLPQWNLPPIVTESICRPHGLNLIVGPRRSGKSSLIQNILQSAQGRQKVVAVYSDEATAGLSSPGNMISLFQTTQLSAKGVLKSADIVMIDSSSLAFCETALRLSEEGRSVLLTLPFWNLEIGFHRLLDLLEGSDASKSRRLATALQIAMGLRLVPGLDGGFHGAFELLLADLEVQKMISQGEISAMMGWLKSQAERTGMRSMNHSLFQLLMKRKVELKAAFEASSEPEELDAMLKKVGI